MSRALALFLAVCVPSSSLAFGPTDDDAPRPIPSQRLLPQQAPAVSPDLTPAPVYKSWALWVGLGALTVGVIAVVFGVWLSSIRRTPVQQGETPTPCGFGQPC